MLKKAIFGGTFDPIHNGHINIAYEALYKLEMDKVIFMPSGNPPHKTEKKITDAYLRYEFVNMAVSGEEKFEVSSYEIDKKSLSYTYKTLEHFKKLEPDTEWYFIAGLDSLMDIEKWMNVESIMKNCTFIVLVRSGFKSDHVMAQKKKIELKYNTNIILLNIPILEISSTDIRNKIMKEQNVSHLMPKEVYYAVKELEIYK